MAGRGRAFFGPPRDGVTPGGAHVSAYLIPVFEGGLIAFDVEAEEARGRWLPWDILEFAQNPYEAASALADNWCNVPVSDLKIVDAMSYPVEGGGWELAIIFRGELMQEPPGDAHRHPHRYEPGRYDAIGPFDSIDLERWVQATPRSAGGAPSQGLVF